MAVQIQPLKPEHDRKGFDCGQAQLNHWLAAMSNQQQARNIARTYVAVDLSDPTTILGFYVLVVSEVEGRNCPSAKRYPLRVPVIRLGRFATALAHQGKGIGSAMLINALEKVYEISALAGVAAVVIDAKDEKAATFYQRHGFLRSLHDPLQLFLFTETLQAAYSASKAP